MRLGIYCVGHRPSFWPLPPLKPMPAPSVHLAFRVLRVKTARQLRQTVKPAGMAKTRALRPLRHPTTLLIRLKRTEAAEAAGATALQVAVQAPEAMAAMLQPRSQRRHPALGMPLQAPLQMAVQAGIPVHRAREAASVSRAGLAGARHVQQLRQRRPLPALRPAPALLQEV